LKSGGQLGTRLKKSKTKDHSEKARKLTHFGASFRLNEMTRVGQNGVVSCISLEKKERERANGAVLNGTISLLLPLDAQRTGEEEAFFPLFFSLLSLSQKPKNQLRPDLSLH
jgi:hypothetical protein